MPFLYLRTRPEPISSFNYVAIAATTIIKLVSIIFVALLLHNPTTSNIWKKSNP